MPPRGAPSVTQPVASPFLSWNHWPTTLKAIVVGIASMYIVSVQNVQVSHTHRKSKLQSQTDGETLPYLYIPAEMPANVMQPMNWLYVEANARPMKAATYATHPIGSSHRKS